MKHRVGPQPRGPSRSSLAIANSVWPREILPSDLKVAAISLLQRGCSGAEKADGKMHGVNTFLFFPAFQGDVKNPEVGSQSRNQAQDLFSGEHTGDILIAQERGAETVAPMLPLKAAAPEAMVC